MRATFLTLAVALWAGCSGPHERAGCGVSTDCPAGEYCARTSDGNVCWPDAVPPLVSGVTVSCATPCLRDSVLQVQATISDDAEVLDAHVTLDVGGPAVPLVRAGAKWTATLPLQQFPFDWFTHGVVATVTARDGARNEASMDAGEATTVTRLRFERRLDAGVVSLGPPAVMQDGTIVTAGTNGKVYFLPWDGAGVSSVAVGTGQITAAPLVLGGSVWIGSEDNKVYEVTPSGNTWSATQRADTGGAIFGSLSETTDSRVIAVSQSGFIYSVTSSEYKNSTPGFASNLGSVIDPGGALFVVTGGSVRRFTFTLGAPTLDSSFSATIGAAVGVPLVTRQDLVVAANDGAHGLLKAVNLANGAVDPITVTSGVPSSGVALLADGSILVPEGSTRVVSRWTSGGSTYAGWAPQYLGGDPRTPVVLAGASAPFVVATGAGGVVALSEAGSIVWSASFGTSSLQPGNLYTPPGQPAGDELSIAYFAGSDGWLHAVIVDGKLDAAAPWPKAFHDTRNTNRAGAPLP